MRELLPPLFQILTGVGFFLVLVVGLGARKAIRNPAGRLTAFALLPLAAGAFCLSRATGASSIGAGGEMFIAAGGCMLVAGVLIALGLLVEARRPARPGQ